MMRVRRAVRWLAIGVLSLILIAALALVGAMSYRAWRQHQGEKILTISTPNGIDEAMFVRIGGAQQWVTIRGQDRRNPVVLLVHGGPGATTSWMALNFVPWEKDFTIVQWDQPGAGRTFGAAGRTLDPALSIEKMAQDGIDVADFIRRRLQTDRIILLGWSWGSALGVHMVRSRPDRFVAYVGTGQMVGVRQGEALGYARVLAKARARGDAEAIARLERIGPPPYASGGLDVQRELAVKYEGFSSFAALLLKPLLLAPRTTLADVRDVGAGSIESQRHFFGAAMNGPLGSLDLRQLGLEFRLPMFVIQGTEDDFTPADPGRAWIESLTAPDKAFLPIEGAGHFALIAHPEEFLAHMKTLRARVHLYEAR